MLKSKISRKFNDSCLKVFALLKLLAGGDAKFADVIQIFANSEEVVPQKANVILNKYMNTIKIFGVQVKKVKNKYVLTHMPFSLKLNEEDLQAVALMRSAINFLPEGKNKKHILKLLRDLNNLYDKDTRELDSVIYINKNYDLSFYFKKFKKQIAECEEYLQNSCKLELIYSHDGNDEAIICIPQEIKYLDSVVCYSVYNTLNRQIFDIQIDSIKNIKVIAQNAQKEQSCTTVIFKLKDDLADRYKLRDWERSEGKDSNGWLTVVNAGEDFDRLCSRLLRYDDKCVVVSPVQFKQKMIETINLMIENY